MIRIEGPLTVWNCDNIEVVNEVVIESESDDEIECKNCLLTHSFINAHTHLPMILLRGLVSERNFWDWLKDVQEIEKEMGKKEIEAGITWVYGKI